MCSVGPQEQHPVSWGRSGAEGGGGAGRCCCHNASASAVTSCSDSLGKVSLTDSQQLSLSLGPPWSKMGQFLSSTFLEGSPDVVWHNTLGEGEHKGAGEAALVFQDQVMYWEEREPIKTQCGTHVTVSRVVQAESRRQACQPTLSWGSTTRGLHDHESRASYRKLG